MNRPFVLHYLAGFSAWALVYRANNAKNKVVPVKDAAMKLREAWVDHQYFGVAGSAALAKRIGPSEMM